MQEKLADTGTPKHALRCGILGPVNARTRRGNILLPCSVYDAAGWRTLVHLGGESSNTLFEVLAEWERHLAQLDPQGLGCRDDKPKP